MITRALRLGALTALALLGCEPPAPQTSPLPSAEPARQRAAPTPSTTARHTTAKGCRALVNLSSETHLDVRFDGGLRVRSRPGIALYDGRGVSVVTKRYERQPGAEGVKLVRTDPKGKPVVWASAPPRPGDGSVPTRHRIRIRSAFGPYLGVEFTLHEHYGGQGSEKFPQRITTLALAGARPLDHRILHRRHLVRAQRIAREQLRDWDGRSAEAVPKYRSLADLDGFAIQIGDRRIANVRTTDCALDFKPGDDPRGCLKKPSPGGSGRDSAPDTGGTPAHDGPGWSYEDHASRKLHLVTTRPNGPGPHAPRQLIVGLHLDPIPTVFRRFAPRDGVFVGPNACGAVSIPKGALMVRDGDGWKVGQVIEKAAVEIIGVTWISGEGSPVPGLDAVPPAP